MILNISKRYILNIDQQLNFATLYKKICKKNFFSEINF